MNKLKQYLTVAYQAIIRSIVYLLFWPKVVYEDKNAIRKDDSPVVFICNHRSFYDGAIVASVLHKRQRNNPSRVPYVLVAKDWYDQKPLHYFLKWFGCQPIDRFSMDTSWFMSSKKQIAEGHSILIFPEGKTSQGEMNEFHPGFAILAERTQAQVVPCTIEGNYRWFRSHTKVTVGTPYALKCPRELKKSEYAHIEAENASKRIACMLNKQAQIVNSPIEAEAVSLSE